MEGKEREDGLDDVGREKSQQERKEKEFKNSKIKNEIPARSSRSVPNHWYLAVVGASAASFRVRKNHL